MELRNPFGLRNNEIVLIEDILQSERGLKCNCICPACKEPFEARMGEVRRHHFAHSGQGCDEVNAYMMGLYMLLNEYISNGKTLRLPPVIIDYNKRLRITEENVEQNTWLLSKPVDTNRGIELYKEKDQSFQSSHIKESNGKPLAIIAKIDGRALAIRITPPSTVCSVGEVKKYKDYPTIEMNFSDLGDTIQQSKKSEFYNCLSEGRAVLRWIYNPVIKKAYSRIIEESKVSHLIELLEENKRRYHEQTHNPKQQSFSQSHVYRNDILESTKIPVKSVAVNGELYSVGTKVKHDSYGVGKIVAINKLSVAKHEISVQYDDGLSRRHDIEVTLKSHLIIKI